MTYSRSLFCFAWASFALAAPAFGQDAAAAGAFAGIPNLTVEYYDVSGRTPQEIRASINANRPRNSNDGERVDGLARWRLRWNWRRNESTCDLSQPRIEFSATILMPRLVNQEAVSARVLARWHAYIAALERHEAGHVRPRSSAGTRSRTPFGPAHLKGRPRRRGGPIRRSRGTMPNMTEARATVPGTAQAFPKIPRPGS